MIVPPNFDPGMGTITGNPPVIMATCGQDVEITSFTGLIIFQIMCPQFNGSQVVCEAPQQVMVFKDGILLPGATNVMAGPGSDPPSEDLCGTYTFVIENSCGRDVEVSTVRCPGQ